MQLKGEHDVHSGKSARRDGQQHDWRLVAARFPSGSLRARTEHPHAPESKKGAGEKGGFSGPKKLMTYILPVHC